MLGIPVCESRQELRPRDRHVVAELRSCGEAGPWRLVILQAILGNCIPAFVGRLDRRDIAMSGCSSILPGLVGSRRCFLPVLLPSQMLFPVNHQPIASAVRSKPLLRLQQSRLWQRLSGHLTVHKLLLRRRACGEIMIELLVVWSS
jgi:hypothetical protein